MAHLGDKLKAYRKAKPWNQFEMSDYLGFSNRKYQEIEKTGKVDKVEDLQTITQKTGIDTQQIAYEEPLEKNKKTENKVTHKDISSLIESNRALAESSKIKAEADRILANTNAELVQLLKEKSVPVNFDFPGLVEEVRQLHSKFDDLLRVQAEEELKREAGQYVDDRDKEARAIAERLRQSGKHGYGKTGKK